MKAFPLLLCIACFAPLVSASTYPAQQPMGHSGLYPHTGTEWVTAAAKPAAGAARADITPGQLIFYRKLSWDSTSEGWDRTGEWAQFISKGVRYQPTPLGLAGGEAGSPMGDLYYVGAPTQGHLYPNAYYEPIWKRDLGESGYIRQLGANNIAIYNLFNAPTQTMESLASDPSQNFAQPASGLIPTSTLLEDSLTPNRTGKTPAPGAGTLPARPVAGSSAGTDRDWAIDFTPYGPLRYQNTQPGAQWAPNAGYFPSGLYQQDAHGNDIGTLVKQAPPHYYHFNHDRFLDICWNGGFLEPTSAHPTGTFVKQLEPMYVWLAIGVSTEAFPQTGTTDTNSPDYYPLWQDYYNSLAAWMAQAYGQHPAVAGFIITNETNDGNDGSYAYYEFINTLHDTLKKYAPDKLTMVSFQDDLASLTRQVTIPATPHEPAVEKYPFEIYAPDVYGWNLYTAPNSQTDIVELFKKDSTYSVDGYRKPVIVTEIGVPATMRYRSVAGVPTSANNEPYLPVPNGYAYTYSDPSDAPATMVREIYPSASNPNLAVLGRGNPAILTLTTAEWEAFKSAGSGDANYGKYYASGLVVYLSDAASGTSPYQMLESVQGTATWKALDFSSTLDPVVALYDQVTRQSLLPQDIAAAGTTAILWSWLNALNQMQVPTDGSAPSGNEVFSGFMVFEYTDEWDKWTDANSDNTVIHTASGVQDFSDKSITGWATPSLPIASGGSDTLSLNTTWDEEWFGLMSVKPVKRSSTDPAINPYGWLNNGPDALEPRLTYYAVQQLFSGSVTPVTHPTTLETAMPTLLATAPEFSRNALQTEFYYHDDFGHVHHDPAQSQAWGYFYDFLGWHFLFDAAPNEDSYYLFTYSDALGSWLAVFPGRWAYSFSDGGWLWIPENADADNANPLLYAPGIPGDPWITLADLLATR